MSFGRGGMPFAEAFLISRLGGSRRRFGRTIALWGLNRFLLFAAPSVWVPTDQSTHRPCIVLPRQRRRNRPDKPRMLNHLPAAKRLRPSRLLGDEPWAAVALVAPSSAAPLQSRVVDVVPLRFRRFTWSETAILGLQPRAGDASWGFLRRCFGPSEEVSAQNRSSAPSCSTSRASRASALLPRRLLDRYGTRAHAPN